MNQIPYDEIDFINTINTREKSKSKARQEYDEMSPTVSYEAGNEDEENEAQEILSISSQSNR